MSSPPPSGGCPSVKGVDLSIICGGIPVITLEKACVFHENVSWMLQSALGASGKADSLYEYIDDKKVVKEARSLGLSSDELGIVRLKSDGLEHVKAVGTTGKRSVMLAVVVALALEDPNNAMDDLWKELRAYKLGKSFVRLLESGLSTVHKGGGGSAEEDQPESPKASPKDSRLESHKESVKPSRKESYKDDYWDSGWEWKDKGGGSAPKSRDRGGRDSRSRPRGGGKDGRRAPAEAPPGNDINVICGMIPVLDMDKTSVFHENVSWLLQTAMDSSGKADSLYEFCNDKEIISVCKRDLGLTDQDIGLVTLKRKDLSHIKAIGTSGKRSIMMAVVVALVLHNEVQCDDLQMDVWETDKTLYKPLDQLIRAAKALCSGSRRSSGGGGGGRSSPGGGAGNSNSYSSSATTAPPPSKRKIACEEEDSDDDGWGDWDAPKAKKVATTGPPSVRGCEGVKVKGARDLSNGALDKMLDDYWDAKERRSR